jgi:regulator of sirC expression with transglutaminase-like and TPR domain
MTWSPASGRKELEARLRRVGGLPDDEIDLAETALLLAALDRPRVPLGRYTDHLEQLCRNTRELAAREDLASSLEGRASALTSVIVERHSYRGDTPTYDDLQNANLMRVIDRRKGLPVALGILYITAARDQGWSVAGLNFPGHFLLRLELGSDGAILDPFDDGRVLQIAGLRELLKTVAGEDAELRPEYYRAVGSREILLRLQNNIKLRLLQAERGEEALAVLESMLMFAPGEAYLWRETGMIHAHLGNLRAAVLSLENFLELGDDPASLHEAAGLLQKVKARLN